MAMDPKKLLKDTQNFAAAKIEQGKEKTQEVNTKNNIALGTEIGVVLFFLIIPLVSILLAINVHGSFGLIAIASWAYAVWLVGHS